MRKLGAKPDVATYTILLGLFAGRKDSGSESAEFFYKLACEEGIILDIPMTRKLMHSLVTSGSFEGATRVFDYLCSLPRTTRYIPLEVYSIVIKARFLMGAPFPVVFRLFFELKRINFVPNKYSYFLLVSPACGADQLRTATDIYDEMVREEEANPSVSLISAHVLTMIISAFLRRGSRAQAEEMYDEMIKRGIRPTSDSYEEIVRSYRKEVPQKVCGLPTNS